MNDPQDFVTPSRLLPDFLLDQISEDLDAVSIQKSDIDQTWNAVRKDFNYIRCKLINGVFSVCANPLIREERRYIVTVETLIKLFKSRKFKDLDFILSLGDCIDSNPNPCPIFAFSEKGCVENAILIPDSTALDPVDRHYITKEILQANRKSKWNDKIDQVFWRGTMNGLRPSPEEILSKHFIKYPRFFLVQLSKINPDFVNAKFVDKSINNWGGFIISKFNTLVSSVHPRDHVNYRYLIDIDGVSCCFSRTYWILLSNSLLVKQVTENKQWYYKGLKPYFHFVPVQENLSDLFERIQWCKEHDLVIQTIAQNGTEFASSYLTYEMSMQYLGKLFSEYQSHLKFQPSFENEDVRDSILPVSWRLYYMVKRFVRQALNKPVATFVVGKEESKKTRRMPSQE